MPCRKSTVIWEIGAEPTTRGGKVWFYHDEDFRKAIGQERWRDLRTKYPDPNPPPELDG